MIFKKNVFFKGFNKNISVIANSTKQLPFLDHIILLCHHSQPAPHTNNIVITYKLFREIQRANFDLLKGCFNKNFTLWQELKKSEIVDTDVTNSEIIISEIGKIKLDKIRSTISVTY